MRSFLKGLGELAIVIVVALIGNVIINGAIILVVILFPPAGQ